MRPINTDIPWSVCLCLLVTTVSCVKTDGKIEMPFGICNWVDPKSHILDRDQDSPGEWAIVKYMSYLTTCV